MVRATQQNVFLQCKCWLVSCWLITANWVRNQDSTLFATPTQKFNGSPGLLWKILSPVVSMRTMIMDSSEKVTRFSISPTELRPHCTQTPESDRPLRMYWKNTFLRMFFFSEVFFFQIPELEYVRADLGTVIVIQICWYKQTGAFGRQL